MSSPVPAGPPQSYPPAPANPPGAAYPPAQPYPPGGPGYAPVQPPPPGPGVTPPFPAPPVEGGSTRLWLGLGAAGLAVLLCCGGGLAAGIGLVVTGAQAVNDRARVVVENYLDDVLAGRYDEAYESLCPDLRQRESARAFADRLGDEPRITGYELSDVELAGGGVIVPVEVRYAEGGDETLRFELEQDQSTGDFEVCGIDG